MRTSQPYVVCGTLTRFACAMHQGVIHYSTDSQRLRLIKWGHQYFKKGPIRPAQGTEHPHFLSGNTHILQTGIVSHPNYWTRALCKL